MKSVKPFRFFHSSPTGNDRPLCSAANSRYWWHANVRWCTSTLLLPAGLRYLDNIGVHFREFQVSETPTDTLLESWKKRPGGKGQYFTTLITAI